METFHKKFIRVGSGRLAFYDEGPRSSEALLLIHGLPTSCYLWRKVVAALKEEYRCVAPDMPGLGDSTCPPDGKLGLSAQAERMADLIDRLDLDRVVALGHDIGGGVAQILALRHRRFISGLALCDSICYDNWPVGVVRKIRAISRNRHLFKTAFRVGAWTRLAYSRHGFRKGVKHPGSISPRQIDEYLRPLMLSETALERFRKLLLSLSNAETREIANEFYRFDKPALIVWALDDDFFPLIWGERLATDFPSSTLETISDCGHFVPEERPQQLVARLRGFLDVCSRS
jgi:pimeloyl-ACP methyl ester carboxylesterase